MIQKTSVLHTDKEVFGVEDKKQLREFIDSGDEDYARLVASADHKLQEAKRQVVRAEHELKRLKNHRGALTAFSIKHKLQTEEK